MKVDLAKANSSSESEDEYSSQDEKDQDDIDEICSKANETMKSDKTPGDDEDSKALYTDIAEDLSENFALVPLPCIIQTVETFYPNMGKIEYVLGEFEKHWMNYNKNFDGYKKGKKDRKNKEHNKHKGDKKKDRKERKHKDSDIQVSPELLAALQDIEAQLDSDISKDEKKELEYKLKDIKKEIRIERKEAKNLLKLDRKALKEQAKSVKKEERIVIKAEKDNAKLEETKARSVQDYEDDVFFREVRKEPSIIKQHLKEAKKALRKATKQGDQDEVEKLTKTVEDLEKSLLEKEDEAIMGTYERYNKNEEAATRLDLHGLKKKEALRLLPKILSIRLKQINAKYDTSEGREKFEFNIVTGRGNHSNGRSVLKPAVKDYLIDSNIEYREFSNGAGYTALL